MGRVQQALRRAERLPPWAGSVAVFVAVLAADYWAGVSPPVPTRSAVTVTTALVLIFPYVTRRAWAAPPAHRLPRWQWVTAAATLVVYVGLDQTLTYQIADYRDRKVGGFGDLWRTETAIGLRDTEPDHPTNAKLLADGAEPSEVWKRWSVVTGQLLVFVAWHSVCLAVAGLVVRIRLQPVPPVVVAQRAGAATRDGLEKTIKDRLPAFDFAAFREKMAQVEGCVCRVELNGRAAGTGFLVGPDAVLTNYHVLKGVIGGRTAPSTVACRFDYKALADGSRVEGVLIGLHADWRLDDSPFASAEATRTPDDPPPTADELDYALVRLVRPVGAEPSNPKGGADAPCRGWITLPADAPALVPGDPLMIAQHPDGRPLKLAVDTEAVIEFTAGGLRLRYATNTEPGSSGSPVFDLNWNLVALHHLGDPASDLSPAYNQGVPIPLIRARIVANGKADAFG